MTSQHYDLLTTIADDGSIKLQQMDYCGESATIHLHPDQLRALSAEFAPSRTLTTTTPADVVLRRFKQVVDAFKDAIYDEHTHNEIWQRTACAEVFYARLAAADDMAEAFITDCESVIVTPVTDNAVTDNTVTPVTGVTDNTVTRSTTNSNAERQAKYRQRKRKASPPPATTTGNDNLF